MTGEFSQLQLNKRSESDKNCDLWTDLPAKFHFVVCSNSYVFANSTEKFQLASIIIICMLKKC